MRRTPLPPEPRTEALTPETILRAAIELLDAAGERGLTVRALSTRLATGAGAIYWHVVNKEELLKQASNDVIVRALATSREDAGPADVIRAVALGLFDAIDAHPWVGAHLSREPWQWAMLQILERVGAQLESLGVPEESQFFAATTLVNYVIGGARQEAANASNPLYDGNREGFLTFLAARWLELDAEKHPFLRRMAKQLATHDDRDQFLAGIDLILAGIAAGIAEGIAADSSP